MFGLKERPYSAHVLIVFGAILIIKTLIFLLYRILADISDLVILAIIKIW